MEVSHVGFSIDSGDSDDFDGGSGNGTQPTTDHRDEVVEKVRGGFGEAVYAAAWNADGFVSAMAYDEAERELAGSILAGADAGAAVFVSGPAAKVEAFAVGSDMATSAQHKALFEAMSEDTFDRLADVGAPKTPLDLDLPTRLTMAAHQAATKGQKRGEHPLAGLFGGG